MLNPGKPSWTPGRLKGQGVAEPQKLLKESKESGVISFPRLPAELPRRQAVGVDPDSVTRGTDFLC